MDRNSALVVNRVGVMRFNMSSSALLLLQLFSP